MGMLLEKETQLVINYSIFSVKVHILYRFLRIRNIPTNEPFQALPL